MMILKLDKRQAENLEKALICARLYAVIRHRPMFGVNAAELHEILINEYNNTYKNETVSNFSEGISGAKGSGQ